MISTPALHRAILSGKLRPAKPRVWVTLAGVTALANAGNAATTYADIQRVTGQSRATISRALKEAVSMGVPVERGYS